MRILVCIPTYNEIENIDTAIDGVRTYAPDADILIVDDNSPDGTGERADERADADEHVHVLHREGKGGLGRAYLAAFAWGLERGYTHLVEMDADGSHRPQDLPRLLRRAARPDRPGLVIGSRWVRGGQVEDWPWYREALSRGGNFYISLMLGLPVRDATAGFRVYSADALKDLDLDSIQAQGYFFQTDMTAAVIAAGLSVVEVPITFPDRVAGTSKLDGSIFVESLVKVTKMGVARRVDAVKRRFGAGE